MIFNNNLILIRILILILILIVVLVLVLVLVFFLVLVLVLIPIIILILILILDFAQAAGMRTGLVTTARVFTRYPHFLASKFLQQSSCWLAGDPRNSSRPVRQDGRPKVGVRRKHAG